MAVTGGSVCEVDAATGSDLNAGWFNPYRAPAGTDQTYGAGQAVTNITDLVSAGTTCTSAAHPFGAADVGNYIRIPAGTGLTAGIYEITSVSVVTATLSSSTGAGSQSGGTIKKGGSLATPTQANTDWGGSDTVYIKQNASVYSMAATITGHGGGNSVRGYYLVREDIQPGVNQNQCPTLQASGTGYALITIAAQQGNMFKNLVLDGNSKAGSVGVTCGAGTSAFFCLKIINCHAGAINHSANTLTVSMFNYCEVSGNSTGTYAINGATGLTMYACDIHGNTTTGAAILANNSVFVDCNIYNNTNNASGQVNNSGNAGSLFINCVIDHGNVNGIIGGGTSSEDVWINCVASNNVSFNFICGAGAGSQIYTGQNMYNCAYYNAATNIADSNASNITGTVVPSVDPFTNSPGGNYILNSTATGGPLLKGTGSPATFPAGITTSARDINAAQAAAPPGGTTSPGVSRIIAGGSQ